MCSDIYVYYCNKDEEKNPCIHLISDLVAMAVPHLGPFISFMGAFCLSLLAVIFPAIMDACTCYAEPKGYGPGNIKLIRDIIIIAIGLFCMCSGIYTSVSDIIAESKAASK